MPKDGKRPPAEPARVESGHREAEVHRDVRPEPEARREVRPEPVRVEAGRRDWDTGDEDTRHYGGYAHAVPEHVFRGERVRVLPERRYDVLWNNQHYFWDYGNGYYLVQPDGEYQVVQPPVGVIVPELPAGAVPAIFGPTTYYYLDGSFYVPQPNGYAVVNPPPGILVSTIPAGAAQVIINGSVAYQFNGSNYMPTLVGGVTEYAVTPG